MQYLEMNKYQTELTEELMNTLPQEVQEQLLETLTTVEFVKRLISPNRPYARDLPRDEKGRIIVDITNPHIIEDADYFRQPAIHFLKHGCYTFLKPNSNPNSEFRKHWDEEKRRCYEGYVRESDGEWVTGFNYWFMNYCPMMVNKLIEGRKKAIRTEAFPFFFEGIYWRFHYLWQAREGGKHSIELAKRGAHPYTEKVYTPEGIKSWGDIKVGDKLYGTYGNITTVTDIPFDGIADTYRITLRDGRIVYASDDHIWNVIRANTGKVLHLNTKYLYEHYISKRKPSWRIPSGKAYIYFVPKNDGVNFNDREVPIDSYTLGVLLGDGSFRNEGFKNQVIFTAHKDDINTYKLKVPYTIDKIGSDNFSYAIRLNNQFLYDEGLWMCKSEDKFIPNLYKYNSREVRLNLLRGLLDSDGSVHGNTPILNTASRRLANDVIEIARSLGYNSNYTVRRSGYKVKGEFKQCLDTYEVSIYGGKELFNLKRKQDVIVEEKVASRAIKTCITNIEYVGKQTCKCVTVDSKDNSYLIGDFIQTHNCAKSYSLAAIMSHNLILGESEESNRRVITVLTAYQKEYLKDDKDGTLSKFKPSINFSFANTPFPHLMLKNSPNEMSWQMGYKDEYGVEKGSLNQVLAVSAKDDSEKLRGKRGWILFEEMGSFKGLLSLYDITRKSVEDGDYTFATMYLVGTAAESESDFSSAKTLLYNPDGYNILSIDNVFDRPKQGKPKFGFFFPSYINRAGCYNKDGVSDVVKALIEILIARYKAKYSADPKSVLRVIAEDPITPAEAIIKVKAAYFPITALTERLSQLDQDVHAYDDVYIGKLVQNSNGVEFTPTSDIPIRKFGVENDTPGAVEIFEMPEKDRSGKVPHTRYIIGHDPVDNDQAESSSLSSTFVLDLWTDKIVAEYTGRQSFADDNFEIVRLLCLFYNAKCLYESNKKGMFAYFSKMNCTHLLADTPEFLRDKQLIKYSSFGSNAKGVNALAAINAYANNLIRDWLMKPVTIIQNVDGEDVEVTVHNLNFLRNRALIEELIAFNPEINVDRVRALGMVMLYREEKMVLYQGNPSRDSEEVPKDYLGNDKFFTENYRAVQVPFQKPSKFSTEDAIK
nr:MAG TPA: Terminase large subunit [Crassvirales sp.]